MEHLAGRKVFVGLSGGVDSAVSAALLKDAGALVTGVFIKGWYPEGMPCTWSEDRQDAMRAAARLGIPFCTLDASAEYKQGVIDYLLHEYRAGRTPNPDVMCNREVKFGAFWRFAQAHSVDFIATGHYAQNVEGYIQKGVDQSKDQSYFLWAVPASALSRTLFPVGGFEKRVTRELAKKYDIPQATKKDSQGVCFLGSISVDDFLQREIGATKGEAVNDSGEKIGIHAGSILSTIGERVALEDASPGPWYVTAKRTEQNVLVVSHNKESVTTNGSIALTQTNWIRENTPQAPITAQYRYHGPLIVGELNQARTVFTPHKPLMELLAPGQSLVCYAGSELLGGGIIA